MNQILRKYLRYTFLLIVFQLIYLSPQAQNLKKAFEYYKSAQYELAADEFEKVLPELENELGKNDTSYYSKTLLYTAICFDNSYKYKKADQYYQACINIYRNIKALNSDTYSLACNNLASLYHDQGKYSLAETLYLESQNITEKLFGKNHYKYALGCNNLAELYSDLGHYNKAEPLYIEAKSINEKIFGRKHISYANSCNNLAGYYSKVGKYEQVESLYRESKSIYELVRGKSSKDYAKSCNNLAQYYKHVGLYNKAKALYIEGMKINEKIFGQNHYLYATDCNNLGTLYLNMSNFSNAEQLLLKAKNIREESLGKNHPDYAISCGNLALLYYELGNFKKCEALYLEAKSIYEKTLGKQHPDYAASCNNLAGMYKAIGLYDKAEALYLEAKNIITRVYGKEHFYYTSNCNNLAVLYYSQEKYQLAEESYLEAKKLLGVITSKEHPYYAKACNNLAVLYTDLGSYKEAEVLYLKARNIYLNLFGNKHQSYLNNCNNLGRLYKKMNLHEKAESYYQESNIILNELLKNSALFMSENEREKYLNNKIKPILDTHYSFFLKDRSKNKALAGIVYDNELGYKGQLLKSSRSIQKFIFYIGDSYLIKTYEKINDLGKVLAHEYSLPLSKRRKDIEDIEEQINLYEKELILKASGHPNFKNIIKSDYSWQDIQKTLKKDEAAIEFINFKYHSDDGQSDSVFYYALIIRKGYKFPEPVYLFEQNQLERVQKKSESDQEYDYIKDLYAYHSIPSKSLYNLIWEPLKQHVESAKSIYISPSGLLYKVAFDAIAYDSLNILSDKHKIIYTSSTSQVIHNSDFSSSSIKNAVLYGGLYYKVPIDEMEKNALNFRSVTENTSSIDIVNMPNRSGISDQTENTSRHVSWMYLPGSFDEVKEIQKVLKGKSINTEVYTKEAGLEEQFKSHEKYTASILHISTHGFYFQYGDESKINPGLDHSISYIFSKNPLLRSGFILSGGNAAFQGKKLPEKLEDGVLTALEVSHLNLFKTKLVVLSACQTGLGDVKGSEGVYGLQRAFKMAGVDYLIFSLWKVPDDATRELMSKFYEFWFEGLEIRDAFKKAQEYLKDKYKDIPGSAFAWAAFVLMK